MKMIIAFAAVLAVALAAPQGQNQATLVNETPSDNIGLDGYKFGYALSDGETREESAQLKNIGSENEALSVTGSFSWVDPVSKQEFKVNYIADENGFRPVGAHLPA